jgi:hypothetical protein
MSNNRSIWSMVPNRSITNPDPSALGAGRPSPESSGGVPIPDPAESFSPIADSP